MGIHIDDEHREVSLGNIVMVQKIPSAILEDENTPDNVRRNLEDEDFQQTHIIYPGEKLSQDDVQMDNKEGGV